MRAFVLSLFILTICSQAIYAQSAVSGKITDTRGEPVVGAVVLLKGTNTYSTSDIKGNYTIQAKAGSVIEFTYLGMESQSVNYNGQTTINIVMKETAAALDEIIVEIGRASCRERV